jgi:hypothetical protein
MNCTANCPTPCFNQLCRYLINTWRFVYYYYLPLFQEILLVGASFAVCVSGLDRNLCSTFSSSSRPNCSDSFCINHAASSGGSSSGGEFITGELVTFFPYSYRKVNCLYFLLTSNESSLLQLQVFI